eukprot:COSAG03_NODE_7522_length_906_cov_0.660471_1_plen_159_part_00
MTLSGDQVSDDDKTHSQVSDDEQAPLTRARAVSLDTSIVSVGRHTAFPTPLRPLNASELRDGVSFILHANIWDTNCASTPSVRHATSRTLLSFRIPFCSSLHSLLTLNRGMNPLSLSRSLALPLSLSDPAWFPWLSSSEPDAPLRSGDDRFRFEFHFD